MSNLNFTNTEILRNSLLSRNLDDSYGFSTPLPNTFTDSTYGIQGTSDLSVNDQLDVSETAEPIIDTIGVLNQYGPEQYSITSIQTVISSIGSQLDYLQSFVPSPSRGSLGLISILTGDDNGEGDTEMVSIARAQLRGMALETMGVKLRESTLGRINALDAINDPTALDGLLTGREKIIERDYQITVPGNPITRAAEYFARVSGTQLPVSYIPGEFFEENVEKGKVEGFLDKAGNAIGQVLNLDFNSHKKTYSQKLLQYTSGGQKSRLFKSVNYNKYKPNFDSSVGGVLNNVVGFVQGLVGLDPSDGSFYVGSPDSDPGTIFNYDSQSNTQKGFIVSGPSKMVKMFEGDIPLNTYPQSGRKYLNGTRPRNTETDFIWIGDGNDIPRGTIDGVAVQSNEKTIKEDTLLGFTEKMVQDASALEGEARLKHPGTVISNVAYKYHDGYKIISKGSGVIGEDDDFCRVWTKDYGYDRYGRLVRHKGIQNNQRRVPGSVIRSQMMLNIAPTKDNNGDNINFGTDKEGNNLTKYMFSIENLAWVGSDKLKDRPICEQGPNDGRIMWFPPYDLKYTDDNRASWTSHTFLGRPEPVYTYNNSERSGTINFKVVVDHPSIVNLLRKKLEKNIPVEKQEEIMTAFFAGCKDYDIYELASEFSSLSMNDVERLDDYLKLKGDLKSDVKDGEKVVAEPETTVTPIKSIFETKYGAKTKDIQLYWFNDVPGPNTTADKTPNSTFDDDLNGYIERFDVPQGEDSDYQKKVNELTDDDLFEGDVNWGENELLVFKGILDNIKTVVEELKTTVNQTLTQEDDKEDTFSFEIKIKATTSAVATQAYNNALASRRAESLKKYLLGDIDQKRIKIVIESTGENPDFQGLNCTKLQNTTKGKIYSKSATYCRTATSTITVLGEPTITEYKEGKTEPTYKKAIDKLEKNPENNDGWDLILKTIHSECDYFLELKETDPLVFGSLVEKLKYFQPGFHSTTPEGLNSRLTFLQQCLRPGETIKVFDENKNEVTDLSSNSAFGKPPICVLRIGDFFHTKMVVDNVNFSYDDALWDMNPEGIGLQPMIASVNMGVKFIGGHGISGAVNELQNALSFNYYANTEVYDWMSTETDGGRDPKKVEEIQNAYKDRMTKQLSDNLNDSELSKDDDEYWGNLMESDNENITYNQFYNNFAESLNDYANELITQTKNVYDKFGNSAVRLLYEKEKRWNIKSVTKYSTTDSVEIGYIGRDDYDYNEAYDKLLFIINSVVDNVNENWDVIYIELRKTINFNEEKNEEYIKINKHLLKEVKNKFSDFGIQIQDSISAVHNKQKSLQESLDAFNIILGDEIDGYKDKDGEYVVKYLNNLTQDNGDLSGDFEAALNKAKKLYDDYVDTLSNDVKDYEISTKTDLTDRGTGDTLNSAIYYYNELLPLFLNDGILDIDEQIKNNVEFDRRIRRKFAEQLVIIKNKNVKTVNVDSVIWENVVKTNQVYDFRLTESIDPSNSNILKDYYTQVNPNKEDSKGIWNPFTMPSIGGSDYAVLYTPPNQLSNDTQSA